MALILFILFCKGLETGADQDMCAENSVDRRNGPLIKLLLSMAVPCHKII